MAVGNHKPIDATNVRRNIKKGAFTFVYFLTHYAAIFNVIRYVAHCLSRINLSSLSACQPSTKNALSLWTRVLDSRCEPTFLRLASVSVIPATAWTPEVPVFL